MSTNRPPLLNLASQVYGTCLAIVPEKLDIILRAVGPRLTTDSTAIQELLDSGALRSQDAAAHADMLKRFASWDDDMGSSSGRRGAEKPYQITDAGVAIIPVSGVLMKKGSWMSALSGCTSYDAIGKSLNAAMDDGQVRAVLFDIDSPGGTTHGCFELSDIIHSKRGQKPMYAVANDLAASAAYAIASAADKVFVTRTAGVGSIGVFCLHCDQSEADSKLGVKYTYVFAGDHKVEGNPHEPISKSAKSSVQAEVDREYDIFTATVARNRSAKQSDIVKTQADVLFADAAVPLLADAVGTLESAIAELSGKVLDSSATLHTTGNRAESHTQQTEIQGAVQTDMAKKIELTADEREAKRKVAAANLLAAQAAMDECEDPEASVAPPTDEDEDDAPKDKSKGKKAAVIAMPAQAAIAAVATAPTVDRTAELQEILMLGKVSGFEKEASDMALAGASVAEVRKTLLDKRAAASAETAVNPNFGAVSTDSLDNIQKQAAALVANSGGTLKPSAALEQALKANPRAYDQYNDERDHAALTPGGVRKYVSLAAPRFAALGLQSSIHG